MMEYRDSYRERELCSPAGGYDAPPAPNKRHELEGRQYGYDSYGGPPRGSPWGHGEPLHPLQGEVRAMDLEVWMNALLSLP